MALQNAQVSKDTTEIKFMLHSKYHLLDVNASAAEHSGVNLLAAASTYGIIILASPASASFQVTQLRHVIGHKDEATVPKRTIPLPAPARTIALSCDHSMLAVSYDSNGSSFINIYSVPSFLSNNVSIISQSIRVCPEHGVRLSQILWNPVLANTMAVCLDNGALCMFVLKDSSYEFFSLDKAEGVKCASWSPKGKQIAVACAGGKLAQYKPDLKLAKTIPCTVQLLPNPFAPIAIQWLSTFQFAVVLVEEKEEACPALFIVNAQKNIPPVYINYDDICYSQSGPRKSQVFMQHILPWNLILVGSANSSEIAILGTTDAGETPSWIQYIMSDDARAELPLSAKKEDTFPIGVALDTGTNHNLIINEKHVPVMPMFHILSTHGLLLSFDLLNLQANAPGICSPPQPINDQSVAHLFNIETVTAAPAAVAKPASIPPPVAFAPPSSNMTFVVPPTAASTPAKPSQPSSLFGMTNKSDESAAAMPATSLFGSSGLGASIGGGFTKPADKTADSGIFGALGLGGQKADSKPFAVAAPIASFAPAPVANVPTTIVAQTTTFTKSPAVVKPVAEPAKPFMTVPNQYVASPQQHSTSKSKTDSKTDSEDNRIFKKMMQEEITTFDAVLKQSIKKSRGLNIQICSKDQLGDLLKRSGQLQEIWNQATDTTESLRSDVHSLRLSLYEALRMSAEADSRIEMLNNPSFKGFDDSAMSTHQANKRQLEMLERQLNEFESRFSSCNREIDASWSTHLNSTKEKERARMHVPTLENVYQTLHKQHAILLKEREKISKIKTKLGISEIDTPKSRLIGINKTEQINTLVDSVLNMTIGDQFQNQQCVLDADKVERLRRTLADRKIWVVKPSRPERKELSSEVVIEKKLAMARAEKAKKASHQQLKSPSVASKPATIQPIASVSQSSKVLPAVTVPVPSFVQAPQATQPIIKPKPKEIIPEAAATAATNKVAEANPSIFAALTTTKPSFGGSIPSSLSFGAKSSPSSTLSFGLPLIAAAPSKSIAQPAKVTSSIFGSLSQSTPASKSADVAKPVGIFGSPSPASAFTAGFSSSFNLAQTKADTPKIGILPSPIAKPIAEKSDSASIMSKETSKADGPPSSAFSFGKALDTTLTVRPISVASPVVSSTAVAVTATKAATPSPFDSTSSPTAAAAATTNNSSVNASNLSPFGLSFGKTAPEPVSSTAATPAIIHPTPRPATNTINYTSPFGLSGSASPLASGSPFGAKPASITTPPTQSVAPQKAEAEPVKPVATTPVSNSFGFGSPASSIFGVAASVAPQIATSFAASAVTSTASSTDPSSIFKDFSICKPTVKENAGQNLFSMSTFGSPAPTLSSGSIFGGAAATPTAAASAASSNIFRSSSGVSAASATSAFGGFGMLSSTGASSTPSTTTPANVFGSVPKPEQSVFGGSSMAASPFGQAATASAASPFGSPAPSTGGNGGFGSPASSMGGNAGFGSPAPSTGGGFGSTPIQANTDPSIFGGSAAQSSQSSNMFQGTGHSIFSTPKQQPAFGSSPFANANASGGASGGSLFGNSPFNSPPSNAPASGGSIFGGGGFGSATNGNTSVFGSPSSNMPFGGHQQQQQQPNNNSFGNSSFAAGGPSIAQTGFGSPTQSNSFSSQPTAFGSPAFGAPATFGTQRSGFGTFSNTAFNNQPANTQQGNSLFESLGSGGNGMTFGNLAQNATAAPAAPKPSGFSGGGGSFSSWR